LASFALQRGFFPRASWRGVLAVIFAGVIADVDSFSARFGPAAYLRYHRSATHSIALVVALALTAFLLSRLTLGKNISSNWNGLSWVAVTAAASLHVLMDLAQADPVAPLWPVSEKHFSLDLAPAIDPWLLVILIAAIVFPELVRLVTDEIGARSKQPRGRIGAIIGLAFALIYFGSRALFHSNVIASLEARTIAGESPRRIAAFPDAVSPFLWHSMVETESSLNLATMRSMGGEVTYATGVTTLRKPDPSPFLAAAQSSSATITFLKFARFPKATVLKESEGYSIEIQDLKDQTMGENNRAIFVDINLDKSGKVISSELQWQKAAPRQ
jgi:inner membrane protein